jgi:hypothetical protein
MPLTHDQIVFWISKFKNGDVNSPDYRRRLIDIFVNSVFLYDDKLTITFNWKDGTQTVTLSELEFAESNGGGEIIGNGSNSAKRSKGRGNTGSRFERRGVPQKA